MGTEWYIEILIFVILLTVIYSDFQFRSISLLQLVALTGGCVALGFNRNQQQGAWANTQINVLFLALQFGLVWLWFAIKHRSVRNVLNEYIGIGDWFFLAAITPAMTPLRFIWYYTTGIILTLVLTLSIKIIYPDRLKTIPLAGCLALWLIVWLFSELFILL